ncbi:MAG: pyruvate formate lyase-activating protein [Clostridia bacterium]|nr:pyruvate formate lyase-activating protein [Clostridia bacterium]
MSDIKGRIHSFQSLGTVDGPGIRFVVFMQGCNLRCGCCHNPDTWEMSAGTEYTADEILAKVLRFREYFGKKGGITLSGGEPLLQSEFAYELFDLCHQNGINTCLDTSGSIMNDSVRKLLTVTDRVLLDIKYADEDSYREYVGCTLAKPIEFLAYLNEQKIPVTLRQVIIPTLTDNEDSVNFLVDLRKKYEHVDKIELLPFRKICQVKYDEMQIDFPFAHIPAAGTDVIKILEQLLG